MKSEHPSFVQLKLYQTGEYPCNYLPGRTATSQVVSPMDSVNDNTYSALIDMGFRRSALYVYRPDCADCQACQSMRILINDFTPTRSQRRCLKQWAHLTVRISDLSYSAEQFELYRRYISTRHADGAMANDTEAQYRQFFLQSPVTSFMVEFRDAEGVLRMVSIIDQTMHGLSAMYTYFDPAPEFSGLGTYGILWQIQTAQQFGLKYVYLGYWIRDSDKMRYKQKFKPAEILVNEQWITLNEPHNVHQETP
jgi:arginine-tRNA-protein transferase